MEERQREKERIEEEAAKRGVGGPNLRVSAYFKKIKSEISYQYYFFINSGRLIKSYRPAVYIQSMIIFY